MSPEAQFEGFQVEEVLSRSSTTNVYRAFQQTLKRTVLIKELRPELIKEDDLRKRFEREARVCAQVKHENIVVIYEYKIEPDQVYVVLEYVDGCSLSDLCQQYSVLPLKLAYSVILQTLKGLSFAHKKGVIHRDLKPGNILLSKDGWVKISDFGLAWIEGESQVTRSGAVVGTPAFLSPEAISGGAVTLRSDIFSLGVTFYQLLTGEKIFHSEHFSDSLNRVLSYQPQKPSHIRSNIPPELDRLILRMLEKQPQKRWESCDGILTTLNAVEGFANLSDPKQPVRDIWENPPENAPAEEVFDKGLTRTPKRLRGRGFIWAGITGVVLITVGMLILIPHNQELPLIASNNQKTDALLAELQDSGTSSVVISATVDSLKVLSQETTEKLAFSSPKPLEQSSSEKETRKPTSSETPVSSELEHSKNENAKRGKVDTASDELIADLIIPQMPSRLKVQCDPWADVYVDGVLIGETPFDYVQIDPGKHQLIFKHPQFAPIVRDITTEPSEEFHIKVDFWETVGRIIILVDTWADVYVDGKSVGVTPLEEPIIVPLGKHTITLKNPAINDWEKEIICKRGDPPCTLRVELKPANG